MVLQTERYNGGYNQQSYSAHQGENGGYNSYQSVSEHSTPYSSFQVPSYPMSHGPPHQSGWSSGGDYYGYAATHRVGGGMASPVKPTHGGYESSFNYENSFTPGNSHHQNYGGSNHQAYGSPHGQDHEGSLHQSYGNSHGHNHGSPHSQGNGSPHGYGKTNGFGGGIGHQINKLTHGSNNYGNSNPNYGYNPSGFNHGYQKPSWTVKGLKDDDDDEE